MADVDIWQSSFNGAELTPLLEGREDISKYPTGCRRLRNAHGLIQGPARRRTGGRYVTATKSNGNAWLVPFIRSRSLAYLLEFGENYIRFYRNRGQLLNPASPFAPYEVVTPWTYAEMTDDDGSFKLRMVQSIDVLYICSEDTGEVVKQLNRFGDTNWTLTDFETVGGPFGPQNLTTTTVYADARTGTVNLVASSAIFESGHIGSLMRLQPQDLSLVPPWEPSKRFDIGDEARNDGKTYESLTSSSGFIAPGIFTGSIGPTHEDGSAYDGQGQIVDPIDGTGNPRDTGILWEFQDPGYGVVKIASVGGGGTTATATVEPWRVGGNAKLPTGIIGSGNATKRWNYSLFSGVDGQPNVITFFRERLCILGEYNFAFSTVNGFDDFSQEVAGQVLADNAFTAQLTSDRDEKIRWAMPAHDKMIIGTSGGEHAVGEMTTQQVFGPNNRKSEPQTGYGSNGVTPVRVGSRLLFVESNGLRVRATQAESDTIEAPSQNDLAEHITFSGVIQQAFQEKPDNLDWCLTNDGDLPCLTFSQEQDVFGWSKHFIGGYRDAARLRGARVRSVASIPSPNGTADDLWYIAERRINGATTRYVEYIPSDDPKPQKWEFETEAAFKRRVLDWQSDLIYLDSAATLDDPSVITNVQEVSGAIRVTVASHGWSNGDFVRIDEVLGAWELNARGYEIENVATNTFDLVDVDVADISAYVSGGVAREMVTTITGLTPWEGETLQVVTDGAVHPDVTVASGSVTLQYPAARVHIGYHARVLIETMRPIGGNERGSAQGQVGVVKEVIMRVESTVGGKLGPNEDSLDIINYRTALDAMDVAIPAFSGDVEFDFPGENDTVRNIVFVQDQPLPTTIVGFGTAQEVQSQ